MADFHMSFEPTIGNEVIGLLPRKGFSGRIVVVDNELAMSEMVQVLRSERLLGYDTETRPAFKKGVSYPMALLQLSTQNIAFLVRLQMVTMSGGLIDVLQSPDIIKVGAAIRDDIKGMQKLKRFKPQGFVDLQQVVEQWGILDKSVKKMAGIVLGIKVSKAQRLSNWEAVTLTPAQMDYAAMDAWVCREIYSKLYEKQ